MSAPDCTAARHGTYSAYRGGCRCPTAREDWRLYQKRRREGRAEPRRLDGTGTRRRIQALWALGHSSDAIAAATGTLSGDHVQRIATRAYVTRGTREAIDRAYRALSAVPGGSDRTRRRARRAGYAPPLAWDDDAIDNPDARPVLGGPVTGGTAVDHIAVMRAVDGDRAVRLTRAERQAAMDLLERRGWSAKRIGAHLGTTGRAVQRQRARRRDVPADRAA